MHLSDLDLSGSYTYADYLLWAFEERLELIKGKIFTMSPAPNTNHQFISIRLASELELFLRNKPCLVFAAPFDVRLKRKSPKDEDIETVVQPDICIVCDPSKIDARGCIGAPDLVVEILSPGNKAKELRNKYEVYEESGIKEYWLVSPQDQTFLKYVLGADQKYVPSKLMTIGDIVTTAILPGFVLELDQIFKGIKWEDADYPSF